MSAIAAFQKAVDAALIGSTDLSALVGSRIYSSNFTDETFPYVTHRPIDAPRDDAACLSRWQITYQISVWSRKNGGTTEASFVLDAIEGALHGQRLALDEPYALAGDVVTTMLRYQDDPDGLTVQGILQVLGTVEKANG